MIMYYIILLSVVQHFVICMGEWSWRGEGDHKNRFNERKSSDPRDAENNRLQIVPHCRELNQHDVLG